MDKKKILLATFIFVSAISLSAKLFTGKTKAQIASSTDPKIPLYAVDLKICKDENYFIDAGLSWDEKQKINVPNPCYEYSIPIWGNSNIEVVPKSFNPDFYFFKTSRGSSYLSTERYGIVVSSFGCYSDFLVPQEEEKYHLLFRKSVDINKEFAKGREWIKVPDEMINVRRIDTEEEVQEMLGDNYLNKQFSSGKKCDIIDSSGLKNAK